MRRQEYGEKDIQKNMGEDNVPDQSDRYALVREQRRKPRNVGCEKEQKEKMQ